MGACHMALLVQAVAILKNSIVHAKLRGLFVHSLHKGRFAARHIFRQHHRRVVGAHNNGGLQKIVYRHGFPLL